MNERIDFAAQWLELWGEAVACLHVWPGEKRLSQSAMKANAEYVMSLAENQFDR